MISLFKNQASRYAAASILMHWLMLAVIVAVYAFINLHDLFPKSSPWHNDLKHWHFICGLLVMFLIGFRLALRLYAGPAPAVQPRPARWMSHIGHWMHGLLYIFMIGMPVLGWLTLSAAGKPIPFDLPSLLEANKTLASNIKDVHETIGDIGYYLIGLHAAAALFHHYFLKDNTLMRMLLNRTSNR